jgi:hypothetical protein
MKDIFPIVKVTWTDSVADDCRWKSIEDAIEWDEETTAHGVTVGHLLYDDGTHVVIALSVMYHTEEQKYSDTAAHSLLRIPKGCIESMITLINAEE